MPTSLFFFSYPFLFTQPNKHAAVLLTHVLFYSIYHEKKNVTFDCAHGGKRAALLYESSSGT